MRKFSNDISIITKKKKRTLSDIGGSNSDYEKASPATTENLATEVPVLSNDRNLIIICGPNGIDFEIFSQTVYTLQLIITT